MATLDDWDAAFSKYHSALGGGREPIGRNFIYTKHSGSSSSEVENSRHNWQYAPAARAGAGSDELITAIYNDLVAIGKAANENGYMKKYATSDPRGIFLADSAIALLRDSNAIGVFNSGKYDTRQILNDLRTLGINEDHIGVLTGADFANKADSLSLRQAYYIANATRASGGLRSQGTG
ncbi:MAG: hypothetical protein NC112_09225 [Oxalobacter formigenes]|nr:hypothetical protein [Oxalobacter formigenes]